MTGITPRQNEVLTAIADLSKGGVCPSLEEIAARIGLSRKSKGVVHDAVRALEQRGRIRRLPLQARSIEIVGQRMPTPAELNRFGTPELLDVLAHVCGILGHRLGPAKVRETLDRIGARLAGRGA